jgi:FkbM family methyltransferase
MAYGAQVLQTDSFRAHPLATLWRSFTWMTCHIGPRRRAVISVKVGRTNFKLDLPPLLKSFGSTGIFVQRSYYEPLLRFCDRLVGAGDVVIDCGANQGIYSCAFAALVGPKGRVLAFEPQPYAVEALRNNLALNGFRQVTVEQAAVSDREGDAALDLSCGSTPASIVHDLGRTKVMRVRTTSLATAGAALDRLNLIKMDIEGAEYDALMGGKSLIDRFRPHIVLESGRRDRHWEKLSNFLAGRGYHAHLFDDRGNLVPLPEAGDLHPCIVYLAA